MSYSRETVEESKKVRQKWREGCHSCPICEEGTPIPLGGAGTYWLECTCGYYSPMCPTLEECLADPSKWQKMDYVS